MKEISSLDLCDIAFTHFRIKSNSQFLLSNSLPLDSFNLSQFPGLLQSVAFLGNHCGRLSQHISTTSNASGSHTGLN